MSDKVIKFTIKINSETGEVVALRKEFDELSNATQKYSETEKNNRKETKKSNQEIKSLNDTINKLKKDIKDFIKIGVIYELTKQVNDLAASFINTASKFEQFNLQLQTLENSSKKAQADLAWIKNFAKTTPYEIDQVTEAFIRLKSYGFKATKDLKILGDTAAAFGKPLEDSVEALADATTGEFERLKAFGIRTYATMNKVAFQWSDKSGQIRHIVIDNNSKIIESTLLAIWNSRYAGGMDKLSQSWSGIFSNISDSWTNFKADVMKISFKKAEKSLKTFQNNFNLFLNSIKKPLSDINVSIVQTFQKNLTAQDMIDAFKGIIRAFGFIKDAITGVELVIETLKLAFYGLAAVVAASFQPIINKINEIIKAANKIRSFFHKKPINVHIESSLPDISNKIVKIEDNIKKLAYSLHNGRDEAEKFAKSLQKSFDETQKSLKPVDDYVTRMLSHIHKTTKEIGEKGALDRNELTEQTKLTPEQMQNIYKQIHSEYVAILPKQQQLVEWKKQELKEANKITDALLKHKAINEINLTYQHKLDKLKEDQLKKEQDLLKQSQKQYNQLYLTPKQQLNAWFNDMLSKILAIKDNLERLKGLKALNGIYTKKEDKIEQNKLGFDDKTYKAYKDLSKKFGENSAKSFENSLSMFMKSANWNDLFSNIGKNMAKNGGTNGALVGFFVQHLQETMTYIFDKVYKHIRNRYTGKIEAYNQISRNETLRAQAYSAFGFEGKGAVASYQADLANTKALEGTYKMDYALMKRAKINKEITQHTMEAASIVAGTAAAVYFDGGAVLQGLNMALDAKNWADKATGFSKFQQQFIQATEQYKEAIKKLADDLIKISGDVYKSIKDYRLIFDKITGSKTYKVQNYKESLSFISKYSDLTTSSLANLTQNVLKASKGFVEGATKTTGNVKNLMRGNIFNKYGLAIDALNSKFKSSLGVIANLIDMQRKAKDAIAAYVAQLKGNLGDTTYNKRYTQGAFAQALKDYYAGKVNGSTLLEKAKAYQAAGGDASKTIKTLQGVEAQSTKDYLKGILNAVTQFSAIGLPHSNIQSLKSPEVQTLDVIKDTKNILERMIDLLGNINFKNLLKGILDGVKQIVKILKNILGNTWKGVIHITKTIWKGVIHITKIIWKGLTHITKTIFSAITELIKKIFNTVKHMPSNIIKSPGSIVRHIGKPISHIFHHFGFAEGGYTGTGIGQRDRTGEIVAGVVHAGEWVAPAWMVNSMPNMFNTLESLRVGHSANNSLFNPVVNVAVDLGLIRETNAILVQQTSIQKKMLRLMQKFDEEGIKCVS